MLQTELLPPFGSHHHVAPLTHKQRSQWLQITFGEFAQTSFYHTNTNYTMLQNLLWVWGLLVKRRKDYTGCMDEKKLRGAKRT